MTLPRTIEDADEGTYVHLEDVALLLLDIAEPPRPRLHRLPHRPSRRPLAVTELLQLFPTANEPTR